jgi:hypothetical protein
LSKKEIDLVVGLGEIGSPICLILNKAIETIGYDKDPQKMDFKKYENKKDNPIVFLHVCIPYVDEKFIDIVVNLAKERKPKGVVIHSTISPHTTEKIQKQLSIPVIYSATRGVHKRMVKDMKKYVKFYSVYDWAPESQWASKTYANRLKKAGLKTKMISSPLVLELAKIVVDTSYYGWLITYAQLSNMIAIENKVDYDEMWSFADEIHKYLGNRPKMFPGFIGGHCLDRNEIVFIKTQLGMRPVTIQDYVEKDYKNDILSYDVQNKKPFFDQVTAKWKRTFSGTMVTLTSRTNRSITTTDEHIMLVSDDLSERFAKDVKTNDGIPFVAQLPELEIKQCFDFESKNWRFGYNMPRSITITKDFCRLLGYYVAEGSVSNYGKGYSTRFSFNKNETNHINDVCQILKSIGINYYITTQNNVTHIGVKSTPFSLFISDTLGCGRNSKTKSLPEFIYFASRKKKEEFLCGYFRGDGSFMPEIGLVQVGTASRLLAAGLDILLLSMGFVMALSEGIHSASVIQGRMIRGGTIYSLLSKKETQYNNLASITGFTESQITRNHDKKLWHTINDNLCMIRTTKTIHQESEQEVYSLDTKNHLFVSTGGRLIHNCVIPNLDLIHHKTLHLIKKLNNTYARKVKNSKTIAKKYQSR